MSVVILMAMRSWTSVNDADLHDNPSKDGALVGPTLISRDSPSLSYEDQQILATLGARQIGEQIWQTKGCPASVIARYYAYGFKLIGQAGSGCGFSGKARYSADVAVTDYRWTWTLIKDNPAPPPYPSIYSEPR